jgi:DMSO/TMAO reductase YedYZ molybdopterin-dependent catalytic subunit
VTRSDPSVPGGRGTALLALLFFAPVTAAAQDGATAPEAPVASRCEVARPGHVVIYGDGDEVLAISRAELERMAPITVEASFHDGRSATFEGVRLRDLLTRAGVPIQVQGTELLRFLVVEATDGYRALFSRSEVEPDFRAEPPILAYRENGRPIDPKFGPLQVIVPDELRHVRWVRQVECIRLETWHP